MPVTICTERIGMSEAAQRVQCVVIGLCHPLRLVTLVPAVCPWVLHGQRQVHQVSNVELWPPDNVWSHRCVPVGVGYCCSRAVGHAPGRLG
jgi:hypothetical protein